MKTLPERTLLRVDEVATWFDVTDRTIYDWIAKKNCFTIHRTPGNSIRITRESVLNYYKNHVENA